MITTQISISNQGRSTVVIDIEGVIGVPEESQFEDPARKTATYEKFRAQVEKISDIDAARIIVNIRSTGGDVNDALLIHDSLCSLRARITTRCYGYVASAATIIAQAASDGCREISSNSLYLIHKSACMAEGNATELTQTLELLDKTDSRIAAIYSVRSGRNPAEFAALMEENNGRGRWLSPQEAVEAGLADKVVKNSPLANNAAQMMAQMGLPPIPDTTTKNQTTTNMTKRWNALKQAISRKTVGDNFISERELDEIGQELEARDQTISSLTQNNAEIEARYAAQVEELQNKVSVLEAQNAKFKALPTMTKPKEDPSHGQQRHSGNDLAYREDLRNFR